MLNFVMGIRDVLWTPRGNVIPADAGIQRSGTSWIPACAGMTISRDRLDGSRAAGVAGLATRCIGLFRDRCLQAIPVPWHGGNGLGCLGCIAKPLAPSTMGDTQDGMVSL
jgi:hypothetical protein